jgi:hypothetical protein
MSWDIMPCSPLNVNRRFPGKYRLHLQDLINKPSKKPARISKRRCNYEQTPWCCIPEDRALQYISLAHTIQVSVDLLEREFRDPGPRRLGSPIYQSYKSGEQETDSSTYNDLLIFVTYYHELSLLLLLLLLCIVKNFAGHFF